jgi:hypothetical protein
MKERIWLALVPPNNDGLAIAEIIDGRLVDSDPIDGERIAAVVFRAMAEEALPDAEMTEIQKQQNRGDN